MKKTLLFSDGKSDKFWSIETNENSFTVNYGKTGTDGQTQTKNFADAETCLKEAEKLMNAKIKKGYAEKGTEAIAPKASNTPKVDIKNVSVQKQDNSPTPQSQPAGNETNKNITLYFQSGTSDKVYHAELKAAEDDSGYIVNVSWGRRGSTLQTSCKTAHPLPLEKAQAVYDKLVAEKTGKGYSPNHSGSLFIDTDKAARVSGLLPQLLNVIEEDMVEQFITDPAYCAQPKHDGERRMIKESQTGVNRKGLTIPLTDNFIETLGKSIQGTADIDGEMVGEHYTTFDIVKLNDVDLRHLPYSERLELLHKHITPAKSISIVETAFTTEEKRALFNRLKDENQEGIVFKQLSAPYTHGRPNKGGTQLKFKFCTSASVYVSAINEGKRSVVMSVLDESGKLREVGSVTIPVSYDIPEKDQIIEVRYLYAYPQGSLYQPVYLGVRPDMELSDCDISQLKYKATN